MKKWWLVIALALSIGANIGILATRLVATREVPARPEVEDAGAGGEVPDAASRPLPRRLPPMVLRMADELGLEGERRDAFVANQRQFFKQTLEARARVRQLQLRLRREVTSTEPDRVAVEELLEQLTAARVDLERAFIDNLLDTREILDPEQQRRFQHFLGRLRQARDEMDRRFQRPQGPRPWEERRRRFQERPGAPPPPG